jgi:toxin ParE1/3/4
MKSLRVTFRPEAQADIQNLLLSIFSVSQNFETTSRYIARLTGRCETIGDAPNGGRRCGPPHLQLRLVPFEQSAIIVYRLEPDRVRIVRIFSSRSDYLKVLAELGSHGS